MKVKQRISYVHGLPSNDSFVAYLDEVSYRSFHRAMSQSEFWDQFISDIVEYGHDVINDVP